jgi:glycosyltransferase involved in cell wall biosynthesis
MASGRKRVGLIFSYDERWIAGAYYILNLVHALKTLPAGQQPELIIFVRTPDEFDKLKSETHYPHVRSWVMRPTNILSRFRNSLYHRLKVKFFDPRPTDKDVDAVFPFVYGEPNYFEHISNKINWIPDFQEHFYPQFFQPQDIASRKTYLETLVQSESHVVLSSENAKQHLDSLYASKRAIVHVLQFAVTHTNIASGIDSIKSKYSIPTHYFICSNQFWKHKNHLLVLQALAMAKAKVPGICVVFTGRQEDHRNPDYFPSLREFVNVNELSGNAIFLGMIPRDEQLALLQHAEAVIQPSLFEGWSTVIEDAKALSRPVYASDIEVHKEQLNEYPWARLFSSIEPESLADQLCQNIDSEGTFLYMKHVQVFGAEFMKIIDSMSRK